MKKSFSFLMGLSVMAICSCTPSKDENKTNEATKTEVQNVSGNTVVETIMSRRSIRKYKPQPIEAEKMQQIVKCGIWAPNGQGRESWQVRVVSNADILKAIDKRYGKPFAYGAPTVVFIAYDPQYDLSHVDCGLLGGNMLLAAQSMGIGSCCLGGIVRFLNQEENTDLWKKLELPESHQLLYAIAFGYPDENPKAKERHTDRVKFIE